METLRMLDALPDPTIVCGDFNNMVSGVRKTDDICLRFGATGRCLVAMPPRDNWHKLREPCICGLYSTKARVMTIVNKAQYLERPPQLIVEGHGMQQSCHHAISLWFIPVKEGGTGDVSQPNPGKNWR